MRRCHHRGEKLAPIWRHAGRVQARYRSTDGKPSCDGMRRRLASAPSFVSAPLCTPTMQRGLPPATVMLEAPPILATNQSLPGGSGVVSWRITKRLLLRLSELCVVILRMASARIDERSCQLLTPVVDVALFGDVMETQGIGARLAREIGAMQDNIIVSARTRRFDPAA
jgi:hypothetical protein